MMPRQGPVPGKTPPQKPPPQKTAPGETRPEETLRAATPRREAQRRRTRAAIVAATTRLIADGASPSIDDIASAADVSRRTVYMYFPTLDQLLLDASLGALAAARMVSDVGGRMTHDDPLTRVDALVRSVTADAEATLPLGRRIIALTVDPPGGRSADGGRRRGYRRIGWLEEAVEPLRAQLSAEQFDRLVAALSVVVGFEAMVVLRDVNGLGPTREAEVMRWAAASLVKAMVAEASG